MPTNDGQNEAGKFLKCMQGSLVTLMTQEEL